ncbi:bifunctional acetyl-CoA hydrolase/transferase family protein/GNAT family N-acetyltransferase [Desulfatiglans anilini]|uniref:bifunctional acetyl-CoA hydrolase/transferase family protein/GNAT family N-acetyltransferase n=1 Tax=Desulfatiglans anilini TaxID=90728 RepID=UPI000416CA75|nr:bifunctional acetyl-CoA hydrolase/transferase family protein/GNAT family N-acetyltransferase [Desulfatiglans anilini]
METPYWADDYRSKLTSPEEALRAIRHGQRVFIGSSCGEPQCLVRELASKAHLFGDIEIVRLLSMESSPLTRIAARSGGDCFNMRSFYLGSGKTRTLERNRRFITPINLSAVPRLLRSRQIPIHAALIQVSPPDDFGWMSLGISVDITLAAAEAASLVIAQVNPRMPRVLGHSFIHVNRVDRIVECEEDLLTIADPPGLEAARQIAGHTVKLIENGATIHIGLGAAPQATLAALTDRKDLGVHSRFLTDGMMKLVGLGVITNRRKGYNNGKLVASAAIGSKDLYAFINDNPCIEFRPSDYVNRPSIIARHNRMVALNVATAMDLTGQVAVDAMPYNNLSGVTDIMDFIRGAAEAPEGKSILMLPSTTLDGKQSRIVPTLDDTAVVVPRGDVQYVVTEYGIVNLFGKSLQERAVAVISIAHPDFREDLFYQARQKGLLAPEQTLSASIFGVYPVKLEEAHDIAGERVLIRPTKPSDERLIQEHFYNMDKEDLVFRFMHEKPLFPRRDVAEMYHIDYIKNLTLLAVTGEMGFETVIAIGGSFFHPARNEAEVAFSVLKDWQGKGIGTILIRKLAEAARESGIAGLSAYTMPQNQKMIKLFHSLPYKVHTFFEEGTLCLTCRFDEPAEG